MQNDLKSILAIFLCLVLTTSLTLKISALLWFHTNQSYIAAELCEKKGLEENTCQGNCQLTKKLNISNEQDTEGNPLEIRVFELMDFVQAEDLNIRVDELPLDLRYNFRVIHTESPYTIDLLKPPIAC